MNEILQITGLNKSYQSNTGVNTILQDLNLSIYENEFVCILGPSGCGKSTLLRCIAGFEEFTGEIRCGGKLVTKPAPDRIMVFQDYNQLFPWKTVEQNITYPLRIRGIRKKDELQSIADHVLQKVGLAQYKGYYPHELSGGMKQRVAIAKALAQKPKIILMDEPFAALDAITRNSLQRELYRISTEEMVTVLFITHNIQEAITLGTRILMMSRSGEMIIDEQNPLPKPVSPSLPGYGALWDRYSAALAGESVTN